MMPASPRQRSISASPELGYLLEIETGKGGTEILALAQDRQPGQAGLKSLQADLFEEPDVIDDRPAPFLVMIALIFRQIAVPKAAVLAILTGNDARSGHFRSSSSISEHDLENWQAAIG